MSDKKVKVNFVQSNQEDDFDLSHEDYYEGVEIDRETLEERARKRTRKTLNRLILLALVLAALIAFFVNKDNLTIENISNWIKTNITGTFVGDGFPVTVTGSNVSSRNFTSNEGNVAVLSDTSFNIIKENGSELLNHRHSFANPKMANRDNNYIIYSIGGINFTVVNENENIYEYTTNDKITTADISSKGNYAIATQPIDFNSSLYVYLEDGDLKFTYDFAKGYITAIKLDEKGEKGMVAITDAENGKIYSEIYVFDFNLPNPTSIYRCEDTIFTHISYNGNMDFYLIGDKKLVRSNGVNFTEYDYEDKHLTAVSNNNDKTLISLTSYLGDGPCEVLVFDDSIKPKKISTENKVEAITASNSSVAVLINNQVYLYDNNQNLIKNVSAGYDTKNIAMLGTKQVYALGLREIRMIDIK